MLAQKYENLVILPGAERASSQHEPTPNEDFWQAWGWQYMRALEGTV